MMLARLVLLTAVLGAVVPDVRAETAPVTPLVRVELLGAVRTIAPGDTFWVALRQRITPGWHTYWTNPGDSGETPRLEWALPGGFTAGEIQWPHPERLRVGPAMSYGYTGEVVLLTRLVPPADVRPGRPVTLRAHVSWLVCEKTCIPEEADVALTLPVATGRPALAPTAAAIEGARRAVPAPSPWPATMQATAETVTVAEPDPERRARLDGGALADQGDGDSSGRRSGGLGAGRGCDGGSGQDPDRERGEEQPVRHRGDEG